MGTRSATTCNQLESDFIAYQTAGRRQAGAYRSYHREKGTERSPFMLTVIPITPCGPSQRPQSSAGLLCCANSANHHNKMESACSGQRTLLTFASKTSFKSTLCSVVAETNDQNDTVNI